MCRADVTIGAHVSYRDRANFGRRAVEVGPAQLVADIEEQVATLAAAIAEVGAGIAYVKPHGALYNAMATDTSVADAVVEAVSGQPQPVLVAQPASLVIERAQAAGVRTVLEGFPDRGYLPDGRLAPRDTAGAVVTDPEEAGRRARSLAIDGGIRAVDGTWTEVVVETLCVHGDTADADRHARAVRATLESSGIVIRAFATTVPHPAAG